MAIPLGYFLIAWAVLLGLYGILVFVTLIQTLKHGINASMTYVTTFLFLVVIAAVIGGCGIFFMQVDWKAEIDVVPSSISSAFFGNAPQTVMKELQLN
jgi:hypothetical protein